MSLIDAIVKGELNLQGDIERYRNTGEEKC
jgi:hypothetical protein